MSGRGDGGDAYRAGAIVPAGATAGDKRIVGAAAAASAAKAARYRIGKRANTGEERDKQQQPAEEMGAATDMLIDTENREQIDDEEDDELGAAGEQPQQKKQPAAKESSRAQGWLTASLPQAARGVLTCQHVYDGLMLQLLEMTDPEREGGAVEGVEPKILEVDDSLPEGPFYFRLHDNSAVRLVVGELLKILPVDGPDNTEHLLGVSLCSSKKDATAYALFEAEGFWGEVYVGKSVPVYSRAHAAQLVSEQLKVMVSSCKYSKAKSGMPQNKTKLCFKAVCEPNSEVKLPPTLKVKQGPYTYPVRYRVDQTYFPNNCKNCHQVGEENCLCLKVKESKAFFATARANAASEYKSKMSKKAAQLSGSSGGGGGTSSASGPPDKAVLEKQRARKKRLAEAAAAGKCVNFVMGRCSWADGACPFGKHEVRSSKST